MNINVICFKMPDKFYPILEIIVRQLISFYLKQLNSPFFAILFSVAKGKCSHNGTIASD